MKNNSTKDNYSQRRMGKTAQHLRMRSALRKRIVGTSIIGMLTLCFVLYFHFTAVKIVNGTSTGDYRSKATGNWITPATWEISDGSNWINATTSPSSSDGAIEILRGHTVTITQDVIVDQLIVDSGAVLSISSSRYLYTNNGTGTDLTVNGQILINGYLIQNNSSTVVVTGSVILSSAATHSMNASATITFNSGGKFEDRGGSITSSSGHWFFNAGSTYEVKNDGYSPPLAQWGSGSTCLISGVISNLPSNMNQSFQNIVWNCPNQNSALNFGGNFPTVNGDLTIISTGSSSIQLDQQGNNTTLNVGGSLYMQGGILYGCTNGGTTVNVTGNYIQTGGLFAFDRAGGTAYGNTSMSFNVGGNISVTGGTIDLSQCSANSANKGNGHLFLNGNLQISGNGSVTVSSANSRGQIYINGSGIIQDFTSISGLLGAVDVIVNPGAIFKMDDQVLSGSGNFTLMSGGTLMLGDPNGISLTGSTGNIQCSGTRTYSTSGDYIYNGTAAQISGNGLPATIHNLTVNNSNNLTLTNSTSATNLITLTSGKIFTSANELGITNTSASGIVGYSTSNYIIGNLRRSVTGTGSYDYPLGTSAYYEPLNLNLSSATGFSNVLGSFVNANPVNPSYPLTGITVNGLSISQMLNYGFWILTPNSNMSGGTYTVTLQEKGHTNSAVDPHDYCVLKRANTTSSWQSLGTHNVNTQSETGGIVTAVRSAYTSFSNFGIGKSSTTLPIELIYFNLKNAKDYIDLSWATASELNNAYFTIERSSDGVKFEELFSTPGAGNSTRTLYYTNRDENPLNGNSYYRLKQTDYDGHNTYSDIKKINFQSNNTGELLKIVDVTPNPFSDNFTLSYISKTTGTVYFQLLNSSGQIVYNDNANTNAELNQFDFYDQKGLPQGIYFMVLFCNDRKITQKIIKK